MSGAGPRPYQVTQSGRAPPGSFVPNDPVSGLDSLHTHHPKSNFSATLVDGLPVDAENTTTRSYAVIGGEFQEVLDRRVDKYRGLAPDQVLLIKDFILDDVGAADTRRVDVPSPIAGVIGRVDPRNGVVDVHAVADGPLVARLRHLGPIAVSVGDTVAYGQSLGTQNRIGLGPRAGKHVHIEMDTRFHRELEHYLLDLVEGRLPVQAAHRAGVAPRPVVHDGVLRVGESGGRMRIVQQALAAAGYPAADGRPIEADGVYRLPMQGAVLAFQRDRGLPPSGDIDAATWREALDRVHGRPALPPPALDALQPGLPPAHRRLFRGIHEQLRALEPVAERGPAASAEQERMACALLRLAVEQGMERVDHVLPGRACDGTRGERIFIVQGRLDDPGQRRAWIGMKEALEAPAAASLARVRALEDPRAHAPEPAVRTVARPAESQAVSVSMAYAG